VIVRNPCTCFVIGTDVLTRVALNSHDLDVQKAAIRTLDVTKTLALQREARMRAWFELPVPEVDAAKSAPLRRTIRHAHNRENDHGQIVRKEGHDAVGDPAIDNLYDYTGLVFQYLKDLGRYGIDGRSPVIEASGHYGRGYDNAFWDGNSFQCGDGDGRIFNAFDELSIVVHECFHGVTGTTAGLVYYGQSGALNESASDCFAQVIRALYLGLGLDDPRAWLIGETLLAPGVRGRALRDMANPGTAYDDPILGRDDQPGNMADYCEDKGDNGGVHRNSGIPNLAFVKVAQALGDIGKAGRILYGTLKSDDVPENCTFEKWARAQIDVAGELYGADAAKVVVKAWSDVGVLNAPRLLGE
jgi:Zn-dependent metalloprotease